MDRSEVKAIVERELRPLSEALGVRHWQITVEFGPVAGRLPNVDGFRLAGVCKRNSPYDLATITLDPEQFDTEKEVLDSLVHELIHVVLAPLDLYRDFATSFIAADSPADRQEDGQFKHAVEQMVVGIERIWRHAPAYWAAKAKEGKDEAMKGKPGGQPCPPGLGLGGKGKGKGKLPVKPTGDLPVAKAAPPKKRKKKGM